MSKHPDYDFENCECECDECGYSVIVDSTDYSTINDDLRADNWIIKKIGDDWHEFCSPECYETYKKAEGV